MMALKRIPKDMSYQAIRHKHPPGLVKKPVEVDSPAISDAIPDAPLEETEEGQEVGATVDVSASHRPPNPDEQSNSTVPKKALKPAVRAEPNSGGNVRIRGYVYLPKSARFSQLAEVYGEGEALRLGLTSGMSIYETALGNASPLGPPPRFEKSGRLEKAGRPFETSRMMTADHYAKAVEHVDPMHMLGRSQIGTRILNVALRYYLDQT